MEPRHDFLRQHDLASRGLRPAAHSAFSTAISSNGRKLSQVKYFHIRSSLMLISLLNMVLPASLMPM